MKTHLSLGRINSAACGNHREPPGCCVTHSFTFGFSTRLQNATEESYRNKAINACLLSCNSVQYFLQISLKSSRFFFLEKSQETCVCENRIHKIQTSTGLYKSISFCQITKKVFQVILSSVKSWSNIWISTKPLTHLPLPKQTITTKRALVMLQFALFLQKVFSSTPLSPLRLCPAKPNTYYAK